MMSVPTPVNNDKCRSGRRWRRAACQSLPDKGTCHHSHPASALGMEAGLRQSSETAAGTPTGLAAAAADAATGAVAATAEDLAGATIGAAAAAADPAGAMRGDRDRLCKGGDAVAATGATAAAVDPVDASIGAIPGAANTVPSSSDSSKCQAVGSSSDSSNFH